MACMGAMHWDRIDFLPVVELFQSLLPGTGSAVFELIRGLYDDQNVPLQTPLALRYRGIPTYPSEAAFRLFQPLFCATCFSGRQSVCGVHGSTSLSPRKLAPRFRYSPSIYRAGQKSMYHHQESGGGEGDVCG